MANPGADRQGSSYNEPWRARMAASLRACAEERERLWGGIDELTLTHYQEGVCTPAERLRVEQALRDHPALRECLEFARELAEEEAAADTPPLPATPDKVRHAPSDLPPFDPSSIKIDTTEEPLRISPRPEPKPILRWLAVAAALVGIVGIGLAYRSGWRIVGPQDIANKDAPPPKAPAPVIVDKDSPRAKNPLPTFEDAIAALEKQSVGMDAKALRDAYGQLLKDYPGHKAEIESNPTLAAALKPQPPEQIAKTPDPVPPPEQKQDTRLAALRSGIAAYDGKPVKVSDSKVRALFDQVILYQKAHPDAKNPELEAFAAAAAPTPANELLYAESRVPELKNAAADSPEVRELRGMVLTLLLRDDTRPLTLESKPLAAFLKSTLPQTPAAKAADMKAEAVALVERLSTPAKRGPYLLCKLPPGIQGESVSLYNRIQTYARSGEYQPDDGLLDYITRARRPIRQDTLGMIIPMYIYPDRNNPGPWDQVMALANQGVRIKIIVSPGIDKAQEADPTYVEAIRLVRAKGIEVLGRGSCAGGPAGIATAQREIGVWHQLYPNMLDGLFFGDQAVEKVMVEPYARLYRTARSLEPRWQIVACPGSPCDEAFLTQTGADILCPSSNPGGPFTEGWEGKYDPERFAALINEVTDETIVEKFLMTAVEKHFGWVYVGGKDPYRVMPPYLEMECRWIAEMNRSILGNNAPAPPGRAKPAAPAKAKGRR